MRKKDRNYYRFAKKTKKKKQNKTIQILASYVHVPQAKKLFNYKYALIVAKLIFCHSHANLPKTSPNKSKCWKKCVFLLHLAGHGQRIKPLYNYAKNVSVLLLFFRILSFLTLSLFSWDLVVKILICFFCDSWRILVESYWQFTLLAK